ncbi:MAG: AAA family ATPase [Candidatus Sumerlaeota bacterium]|nr:AAA family ATPase [Candidatus Sumerlaeota bacterium]
MSEKISIQDFAGIKDISLEIKPINILIGPQAIGKSICAKLLFFFKSLASEIWNMIENNLDVEEFEAYYLNRFHEFFPPQALGDHSFRIDYEIEAHHITISKGRNSKGKEKLIYSPSFRRSFEDTLKRIEDIPLDKYMLRDITGKLHLNESIAQGIDKIAVFKQNYIPAGRSFFTNLQSSIFSFLSSNNALDPFLSLFGVLYGTLKDFPLLRIIDNEIEKSKYLTIQNSIDKILCGRYSHEKKGDYIWLKDMRKIPVMNLSSGQQEFLPLALILRAIPFIGREMGNTVYIEEPEAHLFPDTQREIIELLSRVYNTSRIPTQIIVTTHSPYILTAINNLLQAGHIRKSTNKKQQERLYKVVSADQILDSDDLSVYSLSHTGCVSIMDSKTNLISTNVIDEVSEGLAIQFDKLLNMEQ